VFSEKLKKTLNAYHNRAITTAEVSRSSSRSPEELDAASITRRRPRPPDDEVASNDALALPKRQRVESLWVTPS